MLDARSSTLVLTGIALVSRLWISVSNIGSVLSSEACSTSWALTP
jgi:hypothetical protein